MATIGAFKKTANDELGPALLAGHWLRRRPSATPSLSLEVGEDGNDNHHCW